MLVSVGADLIAGLEYDLDPARADELVLKGYAVGTLSREYAPEEHQATQFADQRVVV
jgi:hypothetical protein